MMKNIRWETILNLVNVVRNNCFVLLLVLILIAGCDSNKRTSSTTEDVLISSPAANDDFFQEIALSVGLDFKHSIGDEELSNIVESSGVGTAFIDFDQDGFLDIYTCNGTWVEKLSSGE